MSPAQRKERRRPGRNRGAKLSERQEEQVIHAAQPMPDWKWRTFPVFAALSLGLFIGVLFGSAAGAAANAGNDIGLLIAWGVAAILVGIAFSRLTTRWMISKQWVKPKPKKR